MNENVENTNSMDQSDCKALTLRLVNRGLLAETVDKEFALMEEIDNLKGEESEEKLDKLLLEFSEGVKLRKKLETRYEECLEESTIRRCYEKTNNIK